MNSHQIPMPCRRACERCGCPTPLFMVPDEVWLEAVGPADELIVLCVGCTEQALGRPLTIDDFPPDVPANAWIHYGYSLADPKTQEAKS